MIQAQECRASHDHLCSTSMKMAACALLIKAMRYAQGQDKAYLQCACAQLSGDLGSLWVPGQCHTL